MKATTKKKIRRCVIFIAACIAFYVTFNINGIAQLLGGAALVVFGLRWQRLR